MVVKLSNSYCPDIDGLRALAIIAVIGYHAFPEYFRGGFFGVDVFFYYIRLLDYRNTSKGLF